MKPLLVLAVLSMPALAQTTTNQTMRCELGEAVRLIEVTYPQGTKLPCEVRYTKGDQTSVLWRAANEAGYCEQKAAEFAEQQRGWGWHCEATDGASPVESTGSEQL